MRVFAVLVLLAVACIGAQHSFADQGTNVNSITFVQHVDETTPLEAIQNGTFDMYYYSVPYDLTGETPPEGIQVYDSVGGVQYTLLVNPADVNEFNPFAYQPVRYSLNFLVDRDSIVNDLLQGQGYPLISHFGPTHPDYLLVYSQLNELGFSYDPDRADSMITDALTASGATKSDGMWMMDDEPITIEVFVRNDDHIRDAIGRSLASNLQDLGFEVNITTGNLHDAFYTVFGSDPADFMWHIYTGAYGGQTVTKYDNSSIAAFYAPWASSMPGRTNPAYWNYENSYLDDITLKLYNEQFENSVERATLVKQATMEAVQEAVRLFLAVGNDISIAKDDITGIVSSQGYGITNRATLINAGSPDDVLNVGVKYISQSSWNPVRGFNDSYSNDIFTILRDYGMIRDPFTGDLTSARTTWEVKTDGPDSTMAIPGDTKMWNPASQQWSTVGHDMTATSKVTLSFALSDWHNGVPMDINDILYAVYFYTEWGQNSTNPDDMDRYPESIESNAINMIKGVRVTGPSQVEIYTDYWHHDKAEIAAMVSLWSSMPWEIYYAMEKIVLNGDAAFSPSSAVEKDIPWLSLLDSSHSALVKEELEKFAEYNTIPAGLYNQFIDTGDRYDASIQWIADKNHAVISNGPFYLNAHVYGETLEANAFIDQSYPLSPDHWLYLAEERDMLEGTITIGSVAPLTGGASNYGADISEASMLAVEHFNEYLERIDASWSLAVDRYDSATNPDTALSTMSVLNDAGIKIIDGPALDYGNQIVDFANNNEMLIMSCCSVTTSLAQNDNVYRMAPGHQHHAAKLAGIMHADGITTVIPVGLDTLWINDLLDLTDSEFTDIDSENSVHPRISYGADMAAVVSELADSVQMHVNSYGTANVAVLYVGFEENVEFIKMASQYDILDDIRWYGAELNTVSPNVTTDDEAQAFATRVNLTSVQLTVHDNKITNQIKEHFADATQYDRPPSVYASYEYDGVWLLGLALLEAQSTDVAKVKNVLADMTGQYIGASGNTEFNSDGDRVKGHYATWKMIDGNWTEIVSIGGLVPITRADGAGIHRQVGTELAMSDFNKYLKENNAEWRLEIDIRDTIVEGYQAPIMEFDADGIQFIAGPSASAGISSIKDHLNFNNMLLVSCCSTAPTLALEKDNVFRLAPSDTLQGSAIAELLRDDGKEVLITVWRDDPFGNGLRNTTVETFTEMGGIADDFGSYPLCNGDGCYDDMFDSLVEELSQQVQEHVDVHGSDKVAILYVGIGEAESFLERAADYPVLHTVQWVGSDANVGSSTFVSNEKVFEFLKNVSYRALIFDPGATNEVSERLEAGFTADPRIIGTPNVYAYSSYDTVWILGLAIEAAGDGGFEEVKRQIPLITADYSGALGGVTLNSAGDGTEASYAIWIVGSDGWIHVGTYMPGIGMVRAETVIGGLFNLESSQSDDNIRQEVMSIALEELNQQNPTMLLTMAVEDISNQPIHTAIQNISHDIDDESNYDTVRQVIDEAIVEFDKSVASNHVQGAQSFFNSLAGKDYGDLPYVFVVSNATRTVVGHVDDNIIGLHVSLVDDSISKTYDQVLEETINSPKNESWVQYMFTRDPTMAPALARALIVEHKGYFFGASYYPPHNGNSLFVGPSSSSDLAALKSYIDIYAPDAVIVSPSSTDPSLAVQDNIFRLAPTDLHQASAIISNINDDGKTQLVIVHRDGLWGNGIVDGLVIGYTGTVHDTISYDIDSPDYATIADELETNLSMLSQSDSAVVFIGFSNEFVELANEINDNPDAMALDVQWYGADGVAAHPAIISDATAAEFAAQVGLTATIFEVAPNPTSEKIAAQIQERDLPVVPYLSEVYDAVYLIGNSIITANNENITVVEAIPGVAEISSGALGDYSLDDAGDLDRPLTYSTYAVTGEEPQWLHKDTLGSISGVVSDGQGGVQGIVVTAQEAANNQYATTMTACDGTFSFPMIGLGEFIISVDAPEGYLIPDGQPNSHTVTLEENMTQSVEFVIMPPSTATSISGTVFSDNNGNGIQDAGEDGISDYTMSAIELHNPSVVREAITGEDGMYTFDNVSSAPCVTLVQAGVFPPGYIVLDSASSWFAYLEPEAEQTATFDLGFYPVIIQQVTLELLVYMDENLNGQHDSGEPGIEGFSVTVHTYALGSETITTGSDGTAIKTDLVPADFGVLVDDFGSYAPTGYTYERTDDTEGKVYDATSPFVDDPELGSVHTIKIGLTSNP